MPSVSVRSCSAFVLKISSKNLLFCQKVKQCGGVATRRTQMLWPMMTVTMTNFEGFTRQWFMWNLGIFTHFCLKFTFFANCCLVKPSKFVTVTVIIGHIIWVLLVAILLSTPTLFDFLMIFLFKKANLISKWKPSKNAHLLMASI